MTYHLIITSKNVLVVESDTPPLIVQHTVDTPEAASAYKQQLETFYNLSPSKPVSGVKCWQTGQIFPTASAAASAVGVSRAAMSQHLNKPDRYPNVRGMVFTRIA